jgi:hypothetical protein
MGGGIALATNGPWDDRNNNPQTYVLYATSGLRRELAPGRFMYDLTHWQSGIGVAKQITTVEKYLGRYRSRSDPSNPWTAYRDELPEMRKLDNSDPLPPLRTATDYRIASIPLEYIVQENIIIEDVNPDQDILDEQSTLDTLYQLNANAQPRDVGTKAVMTYYHGPAIPQGFLFTGFAPWNFKRSSCQALVDFVLQRMWGLSRSATPHFRAAGTEQVRPPATLMRTPSGQALTPSEVARRVRTQARSTSVPRH